jgi:hypothetical protein
MGSIQRVAYGRRPWGGSRAAERRTKRRGGWQTDTHGWLEGHLKEQNYGADWGDFVTFAKHMKHKAGNMGVDLLLIDTGTVRPPVLPGCCSCPRRPLT